jgi:hypothetical protein
MKNEVTNRDLELLSAYLDKELNPKERAYLEERLQSNPNLRSILGELHQNRAALRSLPRLRAPRNFTLSPELVGIKPKKRPYPTFGLVSAFSSLVLILVLVGDFLMNPAMTAQPADEQQALLAATAEIAQDMEPFTEKALEGTPTILTTEQPVVAAQAEPITETDAMALRGAAGTGEPTAETSLGVESLSSLNPLETVTPSPDGYISTPTTSAIPPTDTPTIMPPIAATEITIEERIESVVPSTPTPIETQPSPSGIPFIRILEISLGVITIITGMAALYLRLAR